jgi:hypothetical protein
MPSSVETPAQSVPCVLTTPTSADPFECPPFAWSERELTCL